MEKLMSDLLAAARGEPPKHQSYHSLSHHVDSFISDESRLDTASPMSDDSASHSDSPDCSSSGSTESVTPSSPSYIPLYSPSGYSQSPTYIQGDFYNITPDTESHTSPTLPFSIDAILGSSTGDHSTPDTPAIITSSVTSSHINDWSIFQRMREEDTSLPVVFWCHVCQTYLNNSTDASTHESRHRLNREPTKLKTSLFNQHGYVTRHSETSFLNRLQCGLCSKVVTKCFFSKHLRCHESLRCPTCGFECPTQTRLDDHMNTHVGNQPFTCSTCGSSFSDRRRLYNHTRQHKPSAFSCSYCPRTYKTRYTRDIHERLHTGYRPFPCTVPGCNKAFPQKIQLRLHMRVHGK